MLRILLADDHLVVRAGLQSLLAAQPDMQVIGEATTGDEALAMACATQPDVLIVDITMPGLNGMQVTAQVHARYPAMRILALSAYEDSGYLRELLRVGAAGYVLKRAAAETLIQAIRTVATGGIYLDAALAHTLPALTDERLIDDSGTRIPLSERERTVLQLLAQGYTNKEIALQLDLSVKTVETYKTRAMDKLDLRNRVELVRYALQAGWLATP